MLLQSFMFSFARLCRRRRSCGTELLASMADLNCWGVLIAANIFTSKFLEFQGPTDIVIFKDSSSKNEYIKLCVKKECVTQAETASLPSGERSSIIM